MPRYHLCVSCVPAIGFRLDWELQYWKNGEIHCQGVSTVSFSTAVIVQLHRWELWQHHSCRETTMQLLMF